MIEFNYVDRYHKHLVNSGKTKDTINAYMSPVRGFAKWLISSVGEFSPGYWTAEWVKDYLSYLSRHRKVSTINLAIATLRLFFKWAKDEGLINSYLIGEIRHEPTKPVDTGYQNWLLDKASKNTRKTYLSSLKQFKDWIKLQTNEDFDPSRVTSNDLHEYRLYLCQKYQPATVNNKMFALRNYFHYATESNLIKENPYHKLTSVSIELQAKKTRWLENTEQYALLREVELQAGKRGKKDYAIILIMLDAGLRTSEVCNLKLNDVQLYPVKEAKINITFSKWNRSRTVPIASTPKGEGKRLHAALKAYLQERNKYLEERGKNPEDIPWFFLSTRGQKLSPKCIQKIIKRYRPKETEYKITAHTLRHTFALNLYKIAGLDLQDIAILMGHIKKDGSPNLQTVSIYTMTSDQEIRRRLDDILP